MYATCQLGHQHWGVNGAAGGMLVADGPNGPQVLLTLRSAAVHHGSCWSLPGGAIDFDDADARAAAGREIHEELEISVADYPMIGQHDFTCGGWRYSTVVLAVPEPRPAAVTGWETDAVAWFDLADIDRLRLQGQLHPGFATSWPALRELLTEPLKSAG